MYLEANIKNVYEYSLSVNYAMEKEQVLPDKTKIDLKVNLKTLGYRGNMGKDDILNIQMKQADVLIIKRVPNNKSED